MNIGLVTVIMFGSLFLAVFLGFPIAWALGGVSVIAGFSLWGPEALGIMALSVLSQWSNPILMCLPLFFLLANLLQRSGVGDELYGMIHKWGGPFSGGLAVGTIVISSIFAAIAGVISAAIISMGLIALPSMFKRKYDKRMVLGSVIAGGSLGSLIPPSVVMILYAFVADVSLGSLWFGGFMPGLLWATLFIAYIAIRCHLNPKLGPGVPPGEKATWGEKLMSLKGVIAPVFVVTLILVTIYLGICTPTEASAIGCFGMFIAVAVRGKMTWPVVRDSLYSTFTLTGMVFWLILAATCFNAVYMGLGARLLIQGWIAGLGVSPFAIVIAMLTIMFVMGMVMDATLVILLCGPIFAPIIEILGIDSVWFGILFVMIISIGFCSPPYGFGLFMMRTVVPKDITMGDIYRSILPFVLIQITGLAIVMSFPEIATWLPSTM